jgi:hypothetical protein
MIKAPSTFNHQKCDRCGGAKECSLHLHGEPVVQADRLCPSTAAVHSLVLYGSVTNSHASSCGSMW